MTSSKYKNITKDDYILIVEMRNRFAAINRRLEEDKQANQQDKIKIRKIRDGINARGAAMSRLRTERVQCTIESIAGKFDVSFGTMVNFISEKGW